MQHPPRTLPPASALGSLPHSALRQHFLAEDLFVPGQLNYLPTDLDGLTVGAAMPQTSLPLPCDAFTAGRELGIINIGAPGHVRVGSETFALDLLDCLYVGRDEPEVLLSPAAQETPAFYLLSCPAHTRYPAAKVPRAQAQSQVIGSQEGASVRRLNKCIHPGGIRSCQLVMGFTEIEPGSVWNTMPPHTHSRRAEIYLYFDLGSNILVHLMGEAGNTRHLIVRDRQAVLSPRWSLHAGAGSSSYRFIWGMAGDNQDFADIDPIPLSDLV